MEVKSDLLAGFIMILFMGIQILILHSQKTWGPRWFVPEKWRKNPNAYDYNNKMTKQLFKDEETGVVEEMVCVICMQPVRFEVDSSGEIIK